MKRIKTSPVEISEVKSKIREAIVKKYGSISEFLETKDADKICGGKFSPAYLYEKGAVSVPVLSSLCRYFGIGELTKKTVVTRTITYCLTPVPHASEKS